MGYPDRDPLFHPQETNIEEKIAVAQKLSHMLLDGDTLMVDESSTSAYAMRAVHHPREITLITNSRELMGKMGGRETAAVRKYTWAKKLTPRMLNELIDHIEVYHAEKIDGVQIQRLRIHYNCVGVIEIPELLPIPETEVRMRTRKGVEDSYEMAG